MVPICMMFMREMVTMPMSLITPPRVHMHRAVMVHITWPVRTNKLTIPAFAMRRSHAVITILVTTVLHIESHTIYMSGITIPSVSMAMTMTVVGWRKYPIKMNTPINVSCLYG